MQKGKAAQLWTAIELELLKSFSDASPVSNRGKRTIGFVINTIGVKFTVRGDDMFICQQTACEHSAR